MSRIKISFSRGKGSAEVPVFYTPVTGSIHYVMADPVIRKCALIDVGQDFDLVQARTGTLSAEEIVGFVANEGLEA